MIGYCGYERIVVSVCAISIARFCAVTTFSVDTLTSDLLFALCTYQQPLCSNPHTIRDRRDGRNHACASGLS